MLLANVPTLRLADAFLAYAFRGSWERSISAEERGLARLMLRCPESRDRFARMDDKRFRSFCVEYDLVWEVIAHWAEDNCGMFSFDDYCSLAASIEKDAITTAEADPRSSRCQRRL